MLERPKDHQAMEIPRNSLGSLIPGEMSFAGKERGEIGRMKGNQRSAEEEERTPPGSSYLSGNDQDG